MPEIQDTEITLGTGRLLGLFFGLVIVCAVFFGLGFSMGRNSVKAGLTLEEAPNATQSLDANAGQKISPGTPAPQTAQEDSVASTTNAETQPSGAPVVASPATQANSGPPPELLRGTSLAPSGNYTVQVAAVSKQEDAEALVDALKKKSYPVFIAAASADKLFHVQIGPFGDIRDAEATKAKLTGDGYNPIVKK